MNSPHYERFDPPHEPEGNVSVWPSKFEIAAYLVVLGICLAWGIVATWLN